MALQTNVLRHGEWVTETLSLSSILKRNSESKSESNSKRPKDRISSAPDCGILTKTVVESPVAHWILPVRLRSAQCMDVAFVGEHYVEVRELGRDGQLRDIAKKVDFGSRIRNAKVIGSSPEAADDDEGDIKMEDDDFSPNNHENGDDVTMSEADNRPSTTATGSSQAKQLPPQQLMIVLENGDMVILFLRLENPGSYVFESAAYRPPGSRIVQPGSFAAVDPSSRYVAIASWEGPLIVYELESAYELNNAYVRGEPLRPVKNAYPCTVQGVIHKMEFLFPHPDDDYHIILLLIIRKDNVSKMVIFEWEEEDDNLKGILAEEKRGQPLPPQHQVPLLIIPLTVHSAFFAISDRRIGVCKNALHRPAEFDEFVMEVHETSRFHHGRAAPLWTAWTRPYRLAAYKSMRDNIYLAREDGVVMFLDIDSENILGASVEIGKFDCNIGTSFCSLFDEFNDILIMGGESGPGTIWQIRPRQPNIQLGSIPNWSPAVDFVTAKVTSAVGHLHNGSRLNPWRDGAVDRDTTAPERIFATSGRGVTGAITELRYGLRANIGLEMEFDSTVNQSWIFPVQPKELNGPKEPNRGFHLLFSLGNRSAVLFLSGDFLEVSELEAEVAPYDLTSRTIAVAGIGENIVVQVTESHLVFVGPTQSARHQFDEVFQVEELRTTHASVHGNKIAIAAHSGPLNHIYLLEVEAGGIIKSKMTFHPAAEVTCLCLATVRDSLVISAGVLGENGTLSILFYKADMGAATVPLSIDVSSEASRFPPLEALTSILWLPQIDGPSETAVAVLGTRGGYVVNLLLDNLTEIKTVGCLKVGSTDVQATLLGGGNTKMAVLVLSDGHLTLMSGFQARTASFQSVHKVWVTDAGNTRKVSPSISAASVLHSGLPGHDGNLQLLLAGEGHIMLSELHAQPGPVPRNLGVSGTPMKIIHSTLLSCLIVAVKDMEDRPTLQFLDLNTGNDISRPTDRNSDPVPYVSGLGKQGDQILGLSEWVYEREGETWTFLLVSTNHGRLLVLSMETETAAESPDGERRIRYWTRHKRSGYSGPIYSVSAWSNNVFYCVGETLHWDQLDLEQKKLVSKTQCNLGSVAIALRVVNEKILALTEQNSLEVIGMTPDELFLLHSDTGRRVPADMIDIAVAASVEGGGSEKTIMLVSDLSCSIAGLWVPWDQPGRDCMTLFEADLPASVCKLVQGKTRPSWQQESRTIKYGQIPTTTGTEILGICIDGSLQHFSFLSRPCWKILRLIQNLAYGSPVLYPFTYERLLQDSEVEPVHDNLDGMQVDGDMLQRCFDKRALEELFANPAYAKRLFELLDQLDDGRWTVGFRQNGNVERQDTNEEQEGLESETRTMYFNLLYDILEYYLAPVI